MAIPEVQKMLKESAEREQREQEKQKQKSEKQTTLPYEGYNCKYQYPETDYEKAFNIIFDKRKNGQLNEFDATFTDSTLAQIATGPTYKKRIYDTLSHTSLGQRIIRFYWSNPLYHDPDRKLYIICSLIFVMVFFAMLGLLSSPVGSIITFRFIIGAFLAILLILGIIFMLYMLIKGFIYLINMIIASLFF